MRPSSFFHARNCQTPEPVQQLCGWRRVIIRIHNEKGVDEDFGKMDKRLTPIKDGPFYLLIFTRRFGKL